MRCTHCNTQIETIQVPPLPPRRTRTTRKKTGPKRKMLQQYLEKPDADMLAECRGIMAQLRQALREPEPNERDAALWLMRLGAEVARTFDLRADEG